MKEPNMNETNSEQTTLDSWKMQNLSACEYDSVAGNSAWVEYDGPGTIKVPGGTITFGSDDDDDNSGN